jgi:apolipoprotein N-acyltransferase
MAHPHAFAFFSSLMFCLGIAFFVWVIAQPMTKARDNFVFSFGFSVGGFVFSWLLGEFDGQYGRATAGGYGLGIVGLGLLVFRGVHKNG